MQQFRGYALAFARSLGLLILYFGFAGAGFAFYGYRVIAAELPENLQPLREPPSKATLIFSADGELVGEFYLQNRIVVGFEQIPAHVRQAFVSAEDGRFWEHPGFDPLGIARAAISNYRGTGSKQGASTITQQLTRMLLLSQDRTYYRKMKELLLSTRVERQLSKRTILEMYLNRVYLGHGSYGIQAASNDYFGKDVGELSIAEAAMLAGLVQRPTAYSPLRNLELAKGRQHYVIDRMHIDGHISASTAEAAKAEATTLIADRLPLNHLAAPYFVEHVRRWAQSEFGQERLYDGGLRIFTTLDTRMQNSAEAAVRDGLEALDRRIGFRTPLGHLEPSQLAAFQSSAPSPYLPGFESVPGSAKDTILGGIRYVGAVVEIPKRRGVLVAVGPHVLPMQADDARRLRSWRSEVAEGAPPSQSSAPLQVGDQLPIQLTQDKSGEDVLMLAQSPDVQAAMVVMEPASGAVRALVGGYDFRDSQFNRATQARRQIGSAFKPIIYATAMSKGLTHLDHVLDTPVAVKTAGGVWAPKNYDGKYLGSITLRTALAKSLNTVSVRLVLSTGVDAIISMARRLGIRAPLPRHVSIALGTPDISLIEIVSVYSAFANGGKRIPSQDEGSRLPGRFVERVTTDGGEVLADYRERLPTEQAIPKSLAYLVVDLMKAVVERGTGKKAQGLGWPAAGKTGTSTEWRDAWFVGYTSQLLAGVWVGRDNFTGIGTRATGGSAALPIWLQFMQASHPKTAPIDFAIPVDVILVRANELTGMPAAPGAANSRLVPFARGTVPGRFSVDRERFSRP
ncbi:MAG: PBP1A family penicillin-binding protein [Myxococcales bacterium]|nr:PBP1A family penicillin-binding protein [Myxococcales bacterium]